MGRTSGRPRKPGNKRLPKHMQRKGRAYYLVRTSPETNKTEWKPLGIGYARALAEYHRLMLSDDAPEAPGNYASFSHYLLKKSQYSAHRRGLQNTLTLDDVRAMWKRAGGECEVSGAPFSYSSEEGADPWSPSIDRIDSSKPYTPKNTRLVCLVANVAMNRWGEEVLLKLAGFVVDKDAPSKTKLKAVS